MSFASSNVAVGVSCFAITPHASTNFVRRARAIYVGIGGDITVVNPDNTTCLLVGVGQGSIIPAECIRINAIGTTAASLVGLA